MERDSETMRDAMQGASYLDLLGVPYLKNGMSPAVGLDCRGVVAIYQERLGFALPPAALGHERPRRKGSSVRDTVRLQRAARSSSPS